MQRIEPAGESTLICCCQPCQNGAPCSLADSLPAWTPSKAPSERRCPRHDGHVGHVETLGLPPQATEEGSHILPTRSSGVRITPAASPEEDLGRALLSTPSSPLGTTRRPKTWSDPRWQGGRAVLVHFHERSVSTPSSSSLGAMGNVRPGIVPVEHISSVRRPDRRPGFPPALCYTCLLYTSPSPRDGLLSRMPSSA